MAVEQHDLEYMATMDPEVPGRRSARNSRRSLRASSQTSRGRNLMLLPRSFRSDEGIVAPAPVAEKRINRIEVVLRPEVWARHASPEEVVGAIVDGVATPNWT